VDTSAAVVTTSLDSVPAASTVRASISHYAPGTIKVRLDGTAASGSALVVSENFFPGWRATVDGRPGAVTRANYNLMAVPLPEGAHEIELSFADPAYAKGKWITLIALLLAAVAAVVGIIAEQRRRPTVVA